MALLKGLAARDFRDAGTGLPIEAPPSRIEILPPGSSPRIDGAASIKHETIMSRPGWKATRRPRVISRRVLIPSRAGWGRPPDLLDVEDSTLKRFLTRRFMRQAPPPGRGKGQGKAQGRTELPNGSRHGAASRRRDRRFPVCHRAVHHDTGIPGSNPTWWYIVSREKEHTGVEAVFAVFEGPSRRLGFPPLLCGLYTCACSQDRWPSGLTKQNV